MTRTLATVIAVASAAAPVLAQPKDFTVMAEDFATVCTAAALASGEAQAAAAARGLARVVSAPLGPTRDMAAYASDGTGRSVTVNRQRFADAAILNCQVAGGVSASRADIDALRQRLEADPRMGALDGDVLSVPLHTLTAHFKRRGNTPLVIVQVTASETTTFLSMTHWDLKAGQ